MKASVSKSSLSCCILPGRTGEVQKPMPSAQEVGCCLWLKFGRWKITMVGLVMSQAILPTCAFKTFKRHHFLKKSWRFMTRSAPTKIAMIIFPHREQWFFLPDPNHHPVCASFNMEGEWCDVKHRKNPTTPKNERLELKKSPHSIQPENHLKTPNHPMTLGDYTSSHAFSGAYRWQSPLGRAPCHTGVKGDTAALHLAKNDGSCCCCCCCCCCCWICPCFLVKSSRCWCLRLWKGRVFETWVGEKGECVYFKKGWKTGSTSEISALSRFEHNLKWKNTKWKNYQQKDLIVFYYIKNLSKNDELLNSLTLHHFCHLTKNITPTSPLRIPNQHWWRPPWSFHQ